MKPESALQELSGRVALVTGGSKGIGLAIAAALVEKGAKVCITGQDEAGLDDAVAQLKGSGGEVYGSVVRATEISEVRTCLKGIEKALGALDILVNNIGGVRQFAKFDGISDENWQEVFDANLMSTVRFTRYAVPLLKQSNYGRIINIASVAGKRPGVYNPHYGAVKASVIHLSKYLSNYLGPDKILVNSICPSTIQGGVWNRDVENRARMEDVTIDEAEERMLKDVKEKSAIGEVGTLEDVANLVAFLASDRARFITGTCIQIDGGTIRSIF